MRGHSVQLTTLSRNEMNITKRNGELSSHVRSLIWFKLRGRQGIAPTAICALKSQILGPVNSSMKR